MDSNFGRKVYMYETFLKTQPYRERLRSVKSFDLWRSVMNTALWVTQKVGKLLTSYVTISFLGRLLWNKLTQEVTFRTCNSMVRDSSLS
jgi:hypothetical protein